MRLTRYKMYSEIAESLGKAIRGEILVISGKDDIEHLIDVKNSAIIDVHFPEVDIHSLPFQDGTFDYVISDQVVEHIKDPQLAISECFRVLKKGGTAIHTTCFINYYHPAPIDFWRFSPDALRYLHRDFAEIIQSAGWGNRLALLTCFLGDRFRAINVPDRKFSFLNWLATFNEPNYPISTWIVARK